MNVQNAERAKGQVGRDAVIAAILLALSTTFPAAKYNQAYNSPPVAWCRSVEQVALTTAQAHAAGIPRERIEAGIPLLPTPAARAAAEAVAQIVYVYNADRGVTPNQLAALVYSACVSKEQ